MSNEKLKIAIYSGSIPSTTFIENLIIGVSGYHKVYLFGKVQKKINYKISNSSIKVFGNRASRFGIIFQTIVRTQLLVLLFPKRFSFLVSQIRKQRSFYQKKLAWIRITPVLLNLPDIFHLQWAKDLDLWLFLKELDVKIVLSLRGSHINYSPIVNVALAESYRNNFPKVDAFHAVSDAIREEALKYGAIGLNIKTIYSLLPRHIFELFRLPYTNKSKELKIISVGRHHWVKGYSLALNACFILKQRGLTFTYTIIAEGEEIEELIFMRDQLSLQKEVIFKKGMPSKKVYEYMKQSDVLLLPSIKEGIANVVLEAMALGLPVISTDCGGMQEVVIPNKTGWVVPILDETALAVAIISFSKTSKDVKTEVVINAHKLIKKKFNMENNAQLFSELYQSIV